MSVVIAARDNRTAIGVRRLLRFRRARWEQGLYVVEGERFVRELLSQGRECSLVAVVPEIAQDATFATNARRVIFSNDVMASVSTMKTPCRALAVVPMDLRGVSLLGECDRILVPLGVQDPGNMGTMVRSLSAFSRCGTLLVSPGSVDPFSPKVVRASAGAFGVVKVASAPEPLLALRELGLYSIGLARGGPGTLSPAIKRETVALVVGAEGSGISDVDRAKLDEVVEIPQLAGDSLNAAVAAGIALFCLAPHGS